MMGPSYYSSQIYVGNTPLERAYNYGLQLATRAIFNGYSLQAFQLEVGNSVQQMVRQDLQDNNQLDGSFIFSAINPQPLQEKVNTVQVYQTILQHDLADDNQINGSPLLELFAQFTTHFRNVNPLTRRY